MTTGKAAVSVVKLALAARRVGRVGVEVGRKYLEDGGPLIAAAISFFGLLSVIPLVLFGVWGLGHFLSSELAFRHVVDYMTEYLPAMTDGLKDHLVNYLQELVDSHGTIGWLGVAGLLWSGSQGFVVLEQAMNIALRVPERRSFLESRLLGVGMILLAGGSLALSLAITSALAAIQNYTIPFLHWSPRDLPRLWSLVGAVVPLLLAILSFTVIYRVVPNTRMPWRAAAIAGLVAGLLWDGAKRLFTYYLARNLYDLIYGPIGGLIGLVFWIYYSSVILVLGLELAAVLHDVHPLRDHALSRKRRPQAAES
jgi:membrane protein